jgi:DNA-binding MarR family transcriptional regulator
LVDISRSYASTYDPVKRRIAAVHEDLAAVVSRLARRLRAAEAPVLARAGLTMWEYVTLAHLARDPAESQQALARTMGYDKTRLIALLDGLERRELITRAPEPPDRRAHKVRLTPAGRRSFEAAQRGIHELEAQLLAPLPEPDRTTLRDSLARLAIG